MSETPPAVVFKAFRQLNSDRPSLDLGSRSKPGPWIDEWFAGDGLPDRVLRSLLRHRAVPFKEILESFEFFERVRRRVRAPVVADLCCGHGLGGALWALFDRRVERVFLVDVRRPPSVDRVWAALDEVAPWVTPKLTFIEARIGQQDLPAGTAVIGLHACGVQTDRVLEVARETGGPVAVMPCCYPTSRAPRALKGPLGVELSIDVDRTYRLESWGYSVGWSAIPEVITPMNRVLIGWHPPESRDG